MPEQIDNMKDAIPKGDIALVIMTSGQGLLPESPSLPTTSRSWRIGLPVNESRVVLYHRPEGGTATIYLAEFVETVQDTDPNVDNLQIVRFKNAEELGETSNNWFEFTGRNSQNPIRRNVIGRRARGSMRPAA